MKNTLTITILSLAALHINAQEIINIEAEGSLESTTPLECITISDVTTQNSPADIFMGVNKCIEEEEYANAAQLLAIAGVYGTYDMHRVKDKTAHQAIMVLQQTIFMNLTEEQKAMLSKSMDEELEVGTDNLAEVCAAIRKVGKPEYHPTYMIQHGMGAFMQSDDNPLKEDFDTDAAWELSLESYLDCPK